MTNVNFSLFRLLLLGTVIISFPASADLFLSKAQVSEYKFYKKPTQRQRIQLEDQFYQLFKGEEAALEKYYQIKYLDPLASLEHKNSLLGISNKSLGWGQFVYNRSSNERFLIQVPHRFNDTYTLNIANHLWKNNLVAFVYSNLVHRYNNKNLKRQNSSDFSHTLDSPLIAATRAWIAFVDNAVIIQLHGFSKNKRKTEQARLLNVILSHGVNNQNFQFSKLHKVKACLEQALGLVVGVYPIDTIELGGTKNIIGKEVRKIAPFENFVHVELDKRTRIRLKNDPADSIALFNCIKNAYP